MTPAEKFGATIVGLSVPLGMVSCGEVQATRAPSWRQFRSSPFMHSISKDLESILGTKPELGEQKNTKARIDGLMRFLQHSLDYEGFSDMLQASRSNFPKEDFGHTGKLVTLLCMASAASDFESPTDFNTDVLEAKFGLAAAHISMQIPEIAGASDKKVVDLTNKDFLKAYIEKPLL